MSESKNPDPRDEDVSYTTERPLMPKQEARTNWDMDRVVTLDMEAHDWDTPIAWELLYPDGEEQRFLRRDRDSHDPTEDVIDEMLRRKNRNTTFVAHNGGGYDFIPLVTRLLRRDDVVVKTMLDDATGDIWYVEFNGENGKPRRLQDSMKVMPRGLDNLSADMAQHSKIEPQLFNVEDLPPALNDMDADARDEMLEYLHYDCLALRECLETFTDIVTDISGGNVGTQLTVGSTTMSMYQVAFMDDEPDAPPIHRANEDAEAAMRDAYFGGRTEVFRHQAPDTPDSEYYHFDVNSLYPYVYTKKPVPAGKVTHYDPGMTDAIENMIESEEHDKGGAVKIEGFVPHDTDIPVLPVRSDATPEANTDKVVFPTGYIEGWYSVAELEYAMSIGAVEDVTYKEAYLAERHKPFQKYGGRLYEQKQNIDKSENPARYKVVKFLLNSFYGKFGMSREQSQLVQLTPEEASQPMNEHDDYLVGVEVNHEPGEPTLGEKLNLFNKEDTANASYIRPRIAMAITAYARIEMHKWIRGIRQAGGRVWYCDTDSIVTDLDIRDREHDIHLGVGEDFGEMDLEETPTEAIFLAPKTYAEREDEELLTMKAKGMKDPDWTFDQMREQLQNSHDPLETSWESVRGGKAAIKREQGLQKVEHTRGVTSLDDKRSHDTRNPTELSRPWNIAKREYEQQRKDAEETQSQRLKEKLRQGWNRLMSGQARDSKGRKDSHLNARENKREEVSRRVNEGRDLKLKRERERQRR